LRLDVLFDHGPLGMPPLFGHRKLANFEVYSFPAVASYALAAAGAAVLAALFLGWREARRSEKQEARAAG